MPAFAEATTRFAITIARREGRRIRLIQRIFTDLLCLFISFTCPTSKLLVEQADSFILFKRVFVFDCHCDLIIICQLVEY